mgnify:CR=1 FL=1
MGNAELRAIVHVIRVLVPIVFEVAAVLHSASIAGGGQVPVVIVMAGVRATGYHVLDVTTGLGDRRFAVAAQVLLLRPQARTHQRMALRFHESAPVLTRGLIGQTFRRIRVARDRPHLPFNTLS